MVAFGGATPGATALPVDFTDTLVASVENPTALAFTPDGRLLVATQFGELRLVANDTLAPTPALDLGGALCTADEEGLLGVTVDPAFASNGYVYLYYTRNKSGRCVNRVSRFTMSGSSISLASENVLVDEIPATGNHNAGDLHFGNDGYLYVSVGDGGCDYAGDSGCAGQNDASRDQHVLVGKILRITSTGAIPPSNPFQGPGTGRCNVTGRTTAGDRCQETFAWGLRNPFRFAFDPNTTASRFFVNDVGQGVWEEVDEGVAGADYGWNVREGPCANGSSSNCGAPPAGMTNPIYSYSHAATGCAAITGGAFVPDGVWPAAYDGAYLYGDYTCGKIFLLTPNGSGGYARAEFSDEVGAVVNMLFGPSPQGQALYYTNYTDGGQVRRIESTVPGNRAPTARLTASPTSGALPLEVVFDGSASSDPDAGDSLSYTWSFGDGSPALTTSGAAASHTYTSAGTYTATLTVRDGHGAASPAVTARIDPGNTAPQVTIDSPAPGARFGVGDTITLRGSAVDAEEGQLGAGSLNWRVLRHHDTHTHPFLAPTAGNDVQITQPPPEDLGSGSDGYLELQLTATDSRGVATTVTRDVYPEKVDLTFATDPAALELTIGGVRRTTPTRLTSWKGHAVTLEAKPQSNASGSWAFQAWSDGGAAAHTVVTPAAAATYTASFTRAATPPGLVGAYSFDAGAGSQVADASGRGNAGTVSGASWAAGHTGSGLAFDGVNDWVTVADSASLDLTAGMTLEAWVRPSALGTWRTVLVKERPGGIVYGMYASEGSRPVGQVWTGSERSALGASALPLNAWSHLATTYDGSALRLYVNGSLAGTTAVSGAMAASTGVLRLGGNAIWSEWFAGIVDDVRVYDRALAASEIQQDLQTPVGAAPPPNDTTAPSATSGLAAATGGGVVQLTWSAASDDVGVARYNVHRSHTAGFTPGAANRVGQPTGTSFADPGLPSGTYYYRVTAEDAAGNVGPASGQLTVAVAADQPSPESGLVAAYAFDAGSGSSAADASGRGNTGAVSGAAWVAGKTGSALAFDGVNDWVTVADAASLDLSGAMTLEAWVRPSALGGWRTIVTKERSGGVVYGLVADQGGARPGGQVDIGGEHTASGVAGLPLNAWSHVAATFDGTAVRLYVNGTQAGSVAATGEMAGSSGALRIGGNAIWGEWFAGAIDDVRVYDRALSAAEIQQDLERPVGQPSAPTDAAPAVSVTAPAPGATVGGTVALTAAASDDVGVAGVRFRVDGNAVGGEDTSAPYAVSWDTAAVANGNHAVTAIARDTAGQTTTSAVVTVSVSNGSPTSGGLVLAFSFDGGPGSTVADTSGHGNSGTVSGASWVAGRTGAGLGFDGVDDWVTVADADSLDLTSAMTLEAWVRPASLSGWRTVVLKERPGGMTYALYASQGSRPIGQAWITGERNALGATALAVNAWTHLATTFDGSVLRLYVNGSQAGSATVAGAMPASTGALRLGGNSIWAEWFAGVLDDVRVYNRALGAAEIQRDLQTPVG